MRLIEARVSNFKLLEDVKLKFSTDPQRPLTVIRAENGSGKTSVLYALLWAFYGMRGLGDTPQATQGMRLTSAAIPPDTPVEVLVMVEFEHTDDNGDLTHYRLVRTVTETTSSTDKVERGSERVRLLRVTGAGDEPVEPAGELIDKLVPFRLRNVFFTNGDDVQTFISGRSGNQQRQGQVHRAIKDLLGLDRLQMASNDIEAAYRALRAEAAKSGGGDYAAATKALTDTEAQLEECTARREELSARHAAMTEERDRRNRELLALRGIGDIDEINARIEAATVETARLEAARGRVLLRMREALRAEEFSWSAIGDRLEKGVLILGDLADRAVIPGISIEVLNDRLHLNVCICGEPLPEGSPLRLEVEKLRTESEKASETSQRLTELFYSARQSKAGHDSRAEAGRDFETIRVQLLEEFTQIRDALAAKGAELDALKKRREDIDEDRVRDLVEKVAKVEAQIADANTDLGRLSADITRLEAVREERRARAKEAERAVKLNEDLATKRDVAEDLHRLTAGTLAVLEKDYVERVSERMNSLFMEIVGSHPGFEAGVFSGVHIGKDYDIVVDTHHERRLDTDFELNGASQRALTLSFIWALMEVSGVSAPRIIDTPLGMIAGGVKTRMVEAITKPAAAGMPDFQVILLLTRSEIRDVEALLDSRAGVVSTMSCSKDYPEDLVNGWGADHPVVRLCRCSHRESCRICARHYDAQHDIIFLDEERAI